VVGDEQLAAIYGLTQQAVASQLERAGAMLLERRGVRTQPALDDKAVAAWNGLALAAFAEAIPVLGRQADLAVAIGIAEAALGLLRGPDGRLARSFRSGRTTGRGGLDDYACLADGLVSPVRGDVRRAMAGRGRASWSASSSAQFADAADGWFDTPDRRRAA
jgi:uncharacterized protein YyaL (SSP411 family)